MKKKICKQCGTIINPETDDTLCGYDRCTKCCNGNCLHSIHYNPKVWKEGPDKFLVRKETGYGCKCPKGYHDLFTECRGY